jgi:hypothetical protein
MGAYEDLRAMSDEQVAAELDKRWPNTVTGVQYWLDELARRNAERSAGEIERLTRIITKLTLANVAIAAVAAVAAIAALVS